MVKSTLRQRSEDEYEKSIDDENEQNSSQSIRHDYGRYPALGTFFRQQFLRTHEKFFPQPFRGGIEKISQNKPYDQWRKGSQNSCYDLPYAGKYLQKKILHIAHPSKE